MEGAIKVTIVEETLSSVATQPLPTTMAPVNAGESEENLRLLELSQTNLARANHCAQRFSDVSIALFIGTSEDLSALKELNGWFYTFL